MPPPSTPSSRPPFSAVIDRDDPFRISEDSPADSGDDPRRGRPADHQALLSSSAAGSSPALLFPASFQSSSPKHSDGTTVGQPSPSIDGRPGSAGADSEEDEVEHHHYDSPHAFTIRAVLVGCLLGSVISASNMYLGLTVGWHFGGALFGSIVGFAILKPLSRVLPAYFGGGSFGPRENCTVQSAASAAGGLSVGFTSAIPALYRLGLMSSRVTDDVAALLLWSLAAAYFGLFFAIPLRRYFILKQKLVFPSPTVSAKTIESLHDSSDGERLGRAKARVLVIAFAISFAYKSASWWLPVLSEWHPLYYIGRASGSNALMVADVLWKWRFQLGGAFVGAGMLVGTNTAASFFAGSVLSWAVLGPSLLATHVVATSFGFPTSLDPSKPMDPEEFQSRVTAQYWILWPGVTLMLTTSFAELGARGPSLWRGLRGGAVETWLAVVKLFRPAAARPSPTSIANADDTVELLPVHEKKVDHSPPATADASLDDEEPDPAGPDQQVPVLWWSIGLLVSVVFTITVLYVFFKIPPGQGLLAIILGFMLAFVGIQASGETDINPTGSIGKTSQFVFAAIRTDSPVQMLRTNLIAGQVDMVGDLKTAHLLGASPRSQFLAQAVGSLVAVFISVGLFVLFGMAYPCFLTMPGAASANSTTAFANMTLAANATSAAAAAAAAAGSCPFAAPAVASWTAVSVALTTGVSRTVPATSAYASLCTLIIGIAFTVVKYVVVPPPWRHLLPNLNALGIAMVNPQPHVGVSLAVGAAANAIWRAADHHRWDRYAFAVASGLIAGEGIAGIVEAVYALAGLKHEKLALMVGVPNATEVATVHGWLLGA
ncbi:hypothetical protein HK405_015446 [Cladochytrium tenue]|nr:hypothetical protein HK405_015446 [Cladochytrium tenue]